MPDVILILEDDADRRTRFAAAVRALAPNLQFVCCAAAGEMIQAIDTHLPRARLLTPDPYPFNSAAFSTSMLCVLL